MTGGNTVALPGDSSPIYVQLAGHVTEQILSGGYAEGSLLPSTNDFAGMFDINPATAARALNLLVTVGVLEKRRGIGMAVSPGARRVLAEQRRRTFHRRHIQPLVSEAIALDIPLDEVHMMLDHGAAD